MLLREPIIPPNNGVTIRDRHARVRRPHFVASVYTFSARLERFRCFPFATLILAARRPAYGQIIEVRVEIPASAQILRCRVEPVNHPPTRPKRRRGRIRKNILEANECVANAGIRDVLREIAVIVKDWLAVIIKRRFDALLPRRLDDRATVTRRGTHRHPKRALHPVAVIVVRNGVLRKIRVIRELRVVRHEIHARRFHRKLRTLHFPLLARNRWEQA